jgi:hypothetical protein
LAKATSTWILQWRNPTWQSPTTFYKKDYSNLSGLISLLLTSLQAETTGLIEFVLKYQRRF